MNRDLDINYPDPPAPKRWREPTIEEIFDLLFGPPPGRR